MCDSFSLMCFDIVECLSDTNVFITKPKPRIYSMLLQNPSYSIAGLLPTSFL